MRLCCLELLLGLGVFAPLSVFGSGSAAIWDLRKIAVSADASSCEQGYAAEFAFDDDAATRWSSKWSDNQWILIDLGKPRSISEISLLWEDAFASEYKLEISGDAKTWEEIRHVSDGKGGEESFMFDNLIARYVRMYGVRRATRWGFSLREFVIRGPMSGIEPELGGLVRPHDIVTIFDHDWENLSKRFTRQCAQDPADSSQLSDDELLDLIERRAFDFFWYEVHPDTLFVVDSTTWKVRTSNAAIGMQLGAYVVGHFREYRPREEIYERVERLLDHCWDDPDDPDDLHIAHHEGWTYHWVDIETGKWRGEEHVCTHDSIMYLCGVIAAKHYFAGTRAGEIAAEILEGVKWNWIIHGGRNKKFISNCYAPTYDPPCGGEVRFYDGMKFDYLLPMGAEMDPVPPSYWHNYVLDFPWDSYKGRFWRIERPASWCHQWDHIWFDFRYMKDDYADYFQNSVEATLANRQWCIDHQSYHADLWGVSPSHGPPRGNGVFYGSYGAPPDDLPFQKGVDNDGTITPSATLPSIVFAPEEVIRVARFLYDNYKEQFWRRYGFPDALNPRKNWFDREYVAIDVGPIIINIENYRSRLIYDLFAKEEIVWNGLRRAGFMGIVDNFDESEHSDPYGFWRQVGSRESDARSSAGRADSPTPPIPSKEGIPVGFSSLHARFRDTNPPPPCQAVAERRLGRGRRRVPDSPDTSESIPGSVPFRSGDLFQFKKTDDRVKEGRYALKVDYDLPRDRKRKFFAVRPGRKDFSPYAYLTLWVFNDPGIKPVLVTADKRAYPLALKARRGSRAGWTRLYFEIPDAARSREIVEVRFLIDRAGKGAFWLDGIFLTHEIQKDERDYVIDDFDYRLSRWSADAAYRIGPTSEHVRDGERALKIDFDKVGEENRWAAITAYPAITDWSRFHSLAIWVCGDAALLVKLADGAGRSFDVDTQEVKAEDGWKHLFFNIQANLNPSNCWEPRYDKRDIRKMLFFIEPGNTDCKGTIYLDSIMLTE